MSDENFHSGGFCKINFFAMKRKRIREVNNKENREKGFGKEKRWSSSF
jgi:hypothetical protein